MSDLPNPIDLPLERSLYYGVLMKCLLYGLQMYMFFHSVYLYTLCTPELKRARWLYIVCGAALLALLAIVTFTNAVFMQFMWIDFRNGPGGPLGYVGVNSAIWWQTLGTAASQLADFIGDALLGYRCWVIWGANPYIMILPGLLYCATLSMAVCTTIQSAAPGTTFFKGKVVNFGVPWASLAVAYNVVVTALIVGKLLYTRRQIKGVLPAESLRTYTGVAAILIESAMPFSIMGIIFAVIYSNQNLQYSPAFLFIWGSFGALAPQFIIFRVMLGHGWTRDFASQVGTSATMTFNSTSHYVSNASAGDSRRTNTTVIDDFRSSHELSRMKSKSLV